MSFYQKVMFLFFLPYIKFFSYIIHFNISTWIIAFAVNNFSIFQFQRWKLFLFVLFCPILIWPSNCFVFIELLSLRKFLIRLLLFFYFSRFLIYHFLIFCSKCIFSHLTTLDVSIITREEKVCDFVIPLLFILFIYNILLVIWKKQLLI